MSIWLQVILTIAGTLAILVGASLLIGPVRRRLYESTEEGTSISDLQSKIFSMEEAHEADRRRWQAEKTDLYRQIVEYSQRIDALEKKMLDLQQKNATLLAQIGSHKEAQIKVLGVWSGDDLDVLAERDAVYDAGFEYYALFGEAATQTNILRQLRTGKYSILEIGAHGDADALLINKQKLGAGWWRRALRDRKIRVALVLACFSDSSVADAIKAAGVQHVIAVSGEIEDIAAVEFAQQFYELFASGMKVEQAFDEARLALDQRQSEKLVLV